LWSGPLSCQTTIIHVVDQWSRANHSWTRLRRTFFWWSASMGQPPACRCWSKFALQSLSPLITSNHMTLYILSHVITGRIRSTSKGQLLEYSYRMAAMHLQFSKSSFSAVVK
jgi:hypothetical protein